MRKIVEILGKATIFDVVPANFVIGATFSSGKIGVNTFIGGVKHYPQSAPHLKDFSGVNIVPNPHRNTVGIKWPKF